MLRRASSGLRFLHPSIFFALLAVLSSYHDCRAAALLFVTRWSARTVPARTVTAEGNVARDLTRLGASPDAESVENAGLLDDPTPSGRRRSIAVLGGSLAGVVAAAAAAEKDSGAEVTLFTACDVTMPNLRRIERDGLCYSSPVLPDTTLPKRKLIEAYPRGGREMAGVLSKWCTPAMVREWLEGCGVTFEARAIVGLGGGMGGEKPLVVVGGGNLVDAIESAALNSGVAIRTGVDIASAGPCDVDKSGDGSEFSVTFNEGIDELNYDCLILAGDDVDFTKKSWNNSKAAHTAAESTNWIDGFSQDEPLSRKERMAQEKKKKKELKRREKLLEKSELEELSEDAAVLLTSQVESVTPDAEDIGSQEMVIDDNSTSNEDFVSLKFGDVVSNFGHRVSELVPALFSFKCTNHGSRGLLSDCVEPGELIPRARLTCLLDAPPGKGGKRKGRAQSIPKHVGPLLAKRNELTGTAALRLSALAAQKLHNAKYECTLHVHFAPDIGSVEAVQENFLDFSKASQLVSELCPLFHREVDYDDYNVDTGQFRQIEVPLVPVNLWTGLCQQAGIPHTSRWSDVSPKNVKSLAHLMVDCPVSVSGIRPLNTESATCGGVVLKEINMASLESRLCDRLFFCGDMVDVSGFDGGFNSFACLATGYLAGSNAAASLHRSGNEEDTNG